MSEAVLTSESCKKSAASKPIVGAALALVAALATWGFIHKKHPVFTVPSTYDIGMGASIEARQALLQQQQLAERKNAPLVIAIGGSLLAVAIAIAVPGCCPAVLRVLAAAPWGALWGAAVGYIGAVAYQTLIPTAVQPTVAETVKVQALFFALLGAGMGLMTGAFARSKRSVLTGIGVGALGGGLGGMAYPLATAVAFSGESTEHLIPEGTAVRLLWLGIGFACIGFLVPAMAVPTMPRSSAACPTKVDEKSPHETK